MHDGIKKFISGFLLVILLLGSGTGQIVHVIFHKHSLYNSTPSSLALDTDRTYCHAVQLMLPEFSQPPALIISDRVISIVCIFSQPEFFTPHQFSIEPSGRAPPVLA